MSKKVKFNLNTFVYLFKCHLVRD